MSTLNDRVRNAWNAFTGRDPTLPYKYGQSSSVRPDRPRLSRGNEKSIVTAVLNRISMDCSAISIQHVRLDDNDRFVEEIDDHLNQCLTLEANVDQTGRSFVQDIVLSMLDEGCVAVVPTYATRNIRTNDSFDIFEMRTGKVVEWYPQDVKVKVYNDKDGRKEELILPKKSVAIIENPFYAVMNEPNSTLQRLMRKLSLLDYVDEQTSTGKLDLIIQLPYVIRSDARRKQAEERRKDIEMQLSGSKYGIAYTDGTERITQLNRSVENQLLNQITELTSMLYSQLGITKEIMEGTADEKTMNNYYSRTVEPILSAITDEMKRKFLTQTARSQRQSIVFFRDPFKLVPTSDLAELADKFTRNEIMTSNEIRQIVGMKPSDDPSADELRNKNLSQSNEELEIKENVNQSQEEIQNG
mgnify:CR=1 FL=1